VASWLSRLAGKLWSLTGPQAFRSEDLEARPGAGQWALGRRLGAATSGAAAYALMRDGLLKLRWLMALQASTVDGRSTGVFLHGSPLCEAVLFGNRPSLHALCRLQTLMRSWILPRYTIRLANTTRGPKDSQRAYRMCRCAVSLRNKMRAPPRLQQPCQNKAVCHARPFRLATWPLTIPPVGRSPLEQEQVQHGAHCKKRSSSKTRDTPVSQETCILCPQDRVCASLAFKQRSSRARLGRLRWATDYASHHI
jgi:hypothetical protein